MPRTNPSSTPPWPTRAGVYTAVKVTLEQAAQVRRLSGEGRGVTQIARAVGLSRPTVYRIFAAE